MDNETSTESLPPSSRQNGSKKRRRRKRRRKRRRSNCDAPFYAARNT
jgi:hypothetical protein